MENPDTLPSFTQLSRAEKAITIISPVLYFGGFCLSLLGFLLGFMYGFIDPKSMYLSMLGVAIAMLGLGLDFGYHIGKKARS